MFFAFGNNKKNLSKLNISLKSLLSYLYTQSKAWKASPAYLTVAKLWFNSLCSWAGFGKWSIADCFAVFWDFPILGSSWEEETKVVLFYLIWLPHVTDVKFFSFSSFLTKPPVPLLSQEFLWLVQFMLLFCHNGCWAVCHGESFRPLGPTLLSRSRAWWCWMRRGACTLHHTN